MIGLPMVIQIAAAMLHRTGERTTRSTIDARTSSARFVTLTVEG
jgi:hypothetical protein